MKKTSASESGLFTWRVITACSLCCAATLLTYAALASPTSARSLLPSRGTAGTSVEWPNKVDPRVFAAASAGETDFIIYMAQQADLSAASALGSKEAKGTFSAALFAASAEGQQYQALYKFLSAPSLPHAGLVQGSDENFYGTTQTGGLSNRGTVFKMDASGTVTTLHSFAGPPLDGALPFAALTQGSDGNLYGTTFLGGATNNGTIFKLDAAGAVTTLYSFAGSHGVTPYGALIQASDGTFYGTTTGGGANNRGTVFKMDASGALTTLHSFAGQPNDGASPFGGLIQGSDGNFYGTTGVGGATDNGAVFKMTASGAVTMLHSFAGQPMDGAVPFGGLVEGGDGNFYGTTRDGGAANSGTVFKMNASGAVTTLHSFLGGPLDGANPYAGLRQASDGNFYGTTERGRAGQNGTVYKMDAAGVVTTVHSFAGSDGANPRAGLIQASDGNFYGTTYLRGAANNGTIFRIDSSGALTTLHFFPPQDGANPFGGVIQGSDGNFYGTTFQGGTTNKGAVFKMDPAGAVTTLHSFAGEPSDGATPFAGLMEANDGNFYGTTINGGANNRGTVFKVSSSGALTTLHSFAGQPLGGAHPYAVLIQASDGNLYGTTYNGGASDNGTVFKMNAAGAVTTLHSFAGRPLDGGNPYAELIEASDGNFYSTTRYGGATDEGTVFKMDAAGAVTTLHFFAGQPNDGALPYSGLIQGNDGNFYGTAYFGGASNNGTVFKMNPSGAMTTLHSFAGRPLDGANPYATLLGASDGNFYGTTLSGGGATNRGTIFKLDASGSVTKLYSFGGSDGSNPYAALTEGSDGNFYGTTHLGGGGVGTVFRINIAPPAVQLLSVVSRKTHGTAGGFNVTLPLTGSPGIECRSGGTSGDHTLVFKFVNELTSVGGVSASATQEGGGNQSVAATGSINPADRKEYIVNLSGVPNAQVVTVNLANVNDSAGNSSASVSASMGFLLGDVNQTGAVDGNDVSAVQATTRRRAVETNFKADVNTTGTIDGNDVSIVQGKTRTRLP